MPNWVFGDYAIKGKKENVLKFLNCGLKNSKCKEQTDCKKAYDILIKKAKTLAKASSYLDDLGRTKDKPAKFELFDSLSFGTFRPIPKTYLMYDTTNNEKGLESIIKYQKKKYGAVGWYDWNCMYYGTKWDSDLENFNMTSDGDIVTLTFSCQTAWSYPLAFLKWVKETFDVYVFLCVNEESGDFNFFCELDDDEEHTLNADTEPNEEDFEDEEDYDDAWYEWKEREIDEMSYKFYEYVNDFEID